MESFWVGFGLSLIFALIGGYIVNDILHMPAGGIIGGMLFVGAFNVLSGMACYPPILKILVQSAAGGFIGIRIKKKDLQGFGMLIKPICIMVFGLLLFNIGIGLFISKVTGLSLITSLLSTTPGGLTEVSMMSADMGANQSIVTIMHLCRIVFVIGTFPSMLRYVSRKYDKHEVESVQTTPQAVSKSDMSVKVKNTAITVIIALIGGQIGYYVGMPAGTMSFAMLFVATYNVFTDKATLPTNKRKYVQMCAGLTIGASITMADVLNLKLVILPAIIMLVGYMCINVLLSVLISKTSEVDLTTALFATSPGGVSDMALIAMEVGGDAPKIASMQLVRLLTTVSLFPMMIKWVCSVVE